jgi:energy-coupling factor transporter ATP-binding protein EcfA2
VVGLNLPEARRAALAFAEDFFEAAAQKTRSVETIKVGSCSCRIFLTDTESHLAELAGAFLYESISNTTDSIDPVVHLITRDVLPVTPSIEWARKWIDSHSIVPEIVSYPYRIFIDKNTGSIYLFDTCSQIGVICLRRKSETDLRGMITPFRLMWSWIANRQKASVIHASAVTTKHGAVLFSGASGCGKSTTAINLAMAGNHLISDDCVWIQDGKSYPVFDRAKIKKGSDLSRRIHERGIAVRWFETEGDSKAFFQVSELNRTGTNPTDVAHIFFPVIWPSLSDLTISSKSAFDRLETDSGREVFQNGLRSKVIIAQICKGTPSSILWLSPNSADNIERIYAILEKNLHAKS